MRTFLFSLKAGPVGGRPRRPSSRRQRRDRRPTRRHADPPTLGQPPARCLKAAIRVVGGEVSGLGPKWKGGYGRWVRDMLVWTKALALFRTSWWRSTVLPEQCAQPSRVKGYREIRILLMVRNRHFRPRMLAGKEEPT
jgi:hypothetical protein